MGSNVCPSDDLPSARRVLGWVGGKEGCRGGDSDASPGDEVDGTASAAALAARIEISAEVAQDVDGTRPVEFESDRAGLLLAMGQFCRTLPEPCAPHPFFGSMTAEDWWRWGYLHADHHLRQFGR